MAGPQPAHPARLEGRANALDDPNRLDLPAQRHPFLLRPAAAPLDAATLRARGLRLRDATSFGLPGWWRLRVMAPEAQAALRQAIGVEVPA